MHSFCAPILTLELFAENEHGYTILVGNGCSVDSYQSSDNKLTLQRRIPIFEERGCNMYGSIYAHKMDMLIAYGEKSIALVHRFSSNNPQKQLIYFTDWIQTLYVFKEQNNAEKTFLEMVVLTINNSVELFRLTDSENENSDINVEKVLTVRSDYKAVILYAVMDGEDWNTLRTIVGTVMGDIIISHPSTSSAPCSVLKHHTGMIFGLLIKYSFLFSISDDRSLRMWSLDDARQLDECYGHPTRPFSICHGPEDVIFTGGQDGSICMWRVKADSLSLLKLVPTGRGVIRSLLFVSSEVFFGTDSGFFGSLTIPVNMKKMQITNRYPNVFLQSFIVLSEQLYFILDHQGVLYAANKDSMKEIVRCATARSDSLKLSPCQKYIAFSAGKELHVVRVNDHQCACYCVDNQILDLFWTDSHLFLTLCNFKNMMSDILENIHKWNFRGVRLGVKEIASCATSSSSQVYFGTRKGSIVVVQDSEVKIMKRAHGKKSVTDLKLHDSKLLSIGRDGKLCIWVLEGIQLQLLFWKWPCVAVEIEWPCKFIEIGNQLYVAGFHGRNFVVANYHNGHCVCTISCGGGHRCWQLSFPESVDNSEVMNPVYFEFVTKRKIASILTSFDELNIIKPHLHTSNITSIIAAKRNGRTIHVTGGIDGLLVVSEFRNSESIGIVQRLSVHSSSVYSICVMDEYLISVGGKSEIFIWHLGKENLLQLFTTRLKGDSRLLSVQFISVRPCIQFLVSSSSGKLFLCKLSDNLNNVESCSTLLDSSRNHGIITKVSRTSSDGSHVICAAVTSSGMLHIWRLCKLITENSYKIVEVEKCGLSAVDLYSENGSICVGVGSESGAVSVFQIEGDSYLTKCVHRWHSATCTDLCIRRASRSLLILSVALDCRLAVFSYSQANRTLTFEQSVLLNIADPSSFTISYEDNNVMRSAVVGTSICVVDITKSFTFPLEDLN